MSRESLNQTGNLFDFFHEKVDAAVINKQIPVSEEGIFYLTNLLVERGRANHSALPNTLVDLHLQAQQGDRSQAINSYREMGDRALYITGFFRRSLHKGMVGLEYYLHMGAAAYETLSNLLHVRKPRALGGHKDLDLVFAELAQRFEDCSNVLQEVKGDVQLSKASRSDVDILKLYEAWLETGNPAIAQQLQRLGVLNLPNRDDTPC